MNHRIANRLKGTFVLIFGYILGFFPVYSQYIILDDQVGLDFPKDVLENDETDTLHKEEGYIYKKDKPEKVERIEKKPKLKELKDVKEFFIWFGASKKGQGIHLSWKYSEELKSLKSFQEKKLEIYRLDSKPLGIKDIPSGKRIIRLGVQQISFQDNPKDSNIYYYAIFLRENTDLLPQKVEEGKNLTSPVNFISQEDKDKKIEKERLEMLNGIFVKFEAFQRENTVVLSWEYSGEFKREKNFENKRIELYRFDKLLNSPKEISPDYFIAKVFAEQNLYDDTPDQGKDYYYALFLKEAGKLFPENFQRNRNFIGPLTFKKKIKKKIKKKLKKKKTIVKKTLTLTGLEEIIRNLYYKKKYREAIRRLNKFKSSSDPRIRGKALFYLGLSFFYSQQFRRSIDYFVDPDVMAYYKKRANFWYRRAAKNIK